ncbi:MAG TPA: fibronectin type III domain-containing protein [Kofleriaceae bacterium]
MAVATVLLAARTASANQCRTVAVDFTPASTVDRAAPQIVGWLETPDGTYVTTVFLTRSVGTYGLGNRPGRFDLNSGPLWPYGRRVTTFPVWSHRNGLAFPEVVFQNGDDGNISHPALQSTHEPHYCQPWVPDTAQWDAVTCATANAFTDKGQFSPTATTGYPPRADVARVVTELGSDAADVSQYQALNPFDAVSSATPPIGQQGGFLYTAPDAVADGDYVLMLEVALESDMNDSYNPEVYPSPPGLPWAAWGLPYRGQPSTLYRIPFRLSATADTETTGGYMGYGDPTGADGVLRSPDPTITTGADGTGEGRLAMANGYRARVQAQSEEDDIAPAAPAGMLVADPGARQAVLTFTAPGDDGTQGEVVAYEVRAAFGIDSIDASTFESAPEVLTAATIVPGGATQSIEIDGLLPQTDYTVGVRARDNCGNWSALSFTSFTTAARESGEVDACFVATAAYGSVLANDVGVLRRFRDRVLRRSAIGELAVESYYTFGPALAGLVGESDLLRASARGALAPIVTAVKH